MDVTGLRNCETILSDTTAWPRKRTSFMQFWAILCDE